MNTRIRNLVKKPWLLVLVVLVAGAVILLRLRTSQIESAAEFHPNPLKVTTEVAARGSLAEKKRYLATMEPLATAEVASQVTARIDEVFVDIGDEVSSGELLAVLDGSEAGYQFQATKSRISEAEAEMEGLRMRKVSIEKNAAYWREEAGRAAFLFSEGAIARSELEMASLKEAEAQAALKEIQSRIRALKERQGSLASEAAAFQERLALFSIRSPFDGTVTARRAEPGNLARPGEALFTVEDRSGWRVIFRVPQEDLGLVKIGQTLSGSFGRSSIKGRVDRVSPSVDAARMGRVEATLEKDPGDAAPKAYGRGVSLTIDVTLGTHEDVITIPAEGVIRAGESSFVYTVSGGRLNKQEVIVVASDGERSAVKGLSEGDHVVRNSPFGWAALSEGREVSEE